MVELRYNGPFSAVDVIGTDRMYQVARGAVQAFPENLAASLLRSPDWTLVEPAAPESPAGPALIHGLTSSQTRELVDAGYDTLDALGAATDVELTAVPGIGPGAVRTIRAALGQEPEE